jgi:hypothetical protein
MATNPDAYIAAKIARLDRQATFRVRGRAADFELGDAARRWKPIFPCFCVQDSPENPCTCPQWPIWWLRADHIFAEGDTGRKDADGHHLRYFDVLADSRISIESMSSHRAGAIRIGSRVPPRGVGGVGGRTGGGSGSGTIAAAPAAGWLAGFLLGIAAGAVWDGIKWLGGKVADDLGGDGTSSQSGGCYDEDEGGWIEC